MKIVCVILLSGLMALCASRSFAANQCNILYPLHYDNQQRYCDANHYGVTYNGYFASNNCYSSIDDALNAMNSDPACTQSDQRGSCSILYPLHYDYERRFCNAGYFGVAYNGYLASDTCYNTIDDALNAMNENTACLQSDQQGPCRILYPFQKDNQGQFCGATEYGVAYNGYFASNACYSSIDQAIAAMQADPACGN